MKLDPYIMELTLLTVLLIKWECKKTGISPLAKLREMLAVTYVNPGWKSNEHECVLWMMENWDYLNRQIEPEKSRRRSREAARLCWIDELIESCQLRGIDFNQCAALMNDEYKRVIRKCGSYLHSFWVRYCAAALLQLEYGEKVREDDVSLHKD